MDTVKGIIAHGYYCNCKYSIKVCNNIVLYSILYYTRYCNYISVCDKLYYFLLCLNCLIVVHTDYLLLVVILCNLFYLVAL